jgi:DNA-binding transcriptional MerR regulator
VPEPLSIQEVARQTQLSAYTLRYYEQLGLIGPITRKNSGHRRYGPQDLEAIAFVQRLRATGMSVLEMKRMGELRAQGVQTQAVRMQILFEHRNAVRARIHELELNVQAIEAKLASHGWSIDTNEPTTKELTRKEPNSKETNR